MSPPDVREAPPRQGRPLQNEAHNDLNGDGSHAAQQTTLTLDVVAPDRRCDVCGRVTLRTSPADGLPRHDACEPRHTLSTAPATSWSAGSRAKRGRRSLLARHLLELLRAHPAGLTDDELRNFVPEAPHGSISVRRKDLVVAGDVVDSGRTRPSRHGRDCIVWKAVVRDAQ